MIQLHFDIDEEWLRELEELRSLGGLRTKKELLNNALTILRWAARQRLNGRTIVSVGADGTEREFEMPYLEAVASSAKNRDGDKADTKHLASRVEAT